MNENAQLIETMAKSEIFKDYERAYSEATDLPVALRPIETWQLPFRGKRKENSFCALMATASRSCGGCLRLQDRLCQSARHQPATVTCAYGLCETAVPVRLGNETVGFLQTGQVMRKPPTLAQFDRVAAQMEQQGVKVDREAAKTAYFQTPVVSQKKLNSLTGLLAIFAEHLSMRSNQLAVREANAEPPVIAKAKQYILDHYADELSLASVAAAVHMSLFYFCKMFKRATGINFTEFVARTRIEKAKNLLLNPNPRISEIAYEVGFQSLTHFNRCFKTITRQSPTDYRAQLPAV